jgi:hypothetical protein
MSHTPETVEQQRTFGRDAVASRDHLLRQGILRLLV